MNAFLYLVWTSGRNRFLFGLRRVKTVRYAVALIVGVAAATGVGILWFGVPLNRCRRL